MKVSVWDTYVQRKDGNLMHFDIVVPERVTEPQQVYGYGKSYLKDKPVLTDTLSAAECRFCHIEKAPEHIEAQINQQGYHIIEMENCN